LGTARANCTNGFIAVYDNSAAKNKHMREFDNGAISPFRASSDRIV
jgi:hypothetical protein